MTARSPRRTAERAPVARRAKPGLAAAGPGTPGSPRAGEPGPQSSPRAPLPSQDPALGETQRSPQPSRERAAAGQLSPDTGAVLDGHEAAPVRGRQEVSAGSAPGASALPAGQPRTYTIALPPGLALLSLNDRGHWAARYRRSEALKKAAWALALSQKIPRLERVSVVAEYQPGDMRHRDPDNIAASAKAAIDGCRAAGVLPEDDSRHVTEVTCRIGTLYPKGRLVLTLTEAAATGGEAA